MKRAIESLFLLLLAAAALYFLRGDLRYFYYGQEVYRAKAKEADERDLRAHAFLELKGRIDGARILTLKDPMKPTLGEALLFPVEGAGAPLYVYTRDAARVAASKTEVGAVGLIGEQVFRGRVYAAPGGRVALPGCKLDIPAAYKKGQDFDVNGDAWVLFEGAEPASAKTLLRPAAVALAFLALLAVRTRSGKPAA